MDKRIALLNTSICTEYGRYSYYPITVNEARAKVARYGFVSYIGHQSTADILGKLLRTKVDVSRDAYKQSPRSTALIFKLKARMAEPRELSVEEIEEIGYDLGLLRRSS